MIDWIYIATPPMKDGEDYSENVLAIVEGLKDTQVMCFCYIHGDGGGWAWANCYGQLDGDAEFDDDYNVICWMPIPTQASSGG